MVTSDNFLHSTLLGCINETGAWDSRRDRSITGTANTLLTRSSSFRLLLTVAGYCDLTTKTPVRAQVSLCPLQAREGRSEQQSKRKSRPLLT